MCGCAVDTSEPEQLGETQAALCQKNALSQSQEQTALKLIDDICGDTWCSGDNDFSFERLTCTTSRPHEIGECRLSFHIIPRDTTTPQLYARSCTTKDFTGFDSLVATTPSGYQSLQPDYYMALTDCISERQAKLRR